MASNTTIADIFGLFAFSSGSGTREVVLGWCRELMEVQAARDTARLARLTDAVGCWCPTFQQDQHVAHNKAVAVTLYQALNGLLADVAAYEARQAAALLAALDGDEDSDEFAFDYDALNGSAADEVAAREVAVAHAVAVLAAGCCPGCGQALAADDPVADGVQYCPECCAEALDGWQPGGRVCQARPDYSDCAGMPESVVPRYFTGLCCGLQGAAPGCSYIAFADGPEPGAVETFIAVVPGFEHEWQGGRPAEQCPARSVPGLVCYQASRRAGNIVDWLAVALFGALLAVFCGLHSAAGCW